MRSQLRHPWLPLVLGVDGRLLPRAHVLPRRHRIGRPLQHHARAAGGGRELPAGLREESLDAPGAEPLQAREPVLLCPHRHSLGVSRAQDTLWLPSWPNMDPLLRVLGEPSREGRHPQPEPEHRQPERGTLGRRALADVHEQGLRARHEHGARGPGVQRAALEGRGQGAPLAQRRNHGAGADQRRPRRRALLHAGSYLREHVQLVRHPQRGLPLGLLRAR
mmetsp:Transcript_72933/g.206941  ORF Transcript_72933/g.206941 Transcript_72933/m.206941 type:complete len:220 (-) Transcript_72933:473-1132(-)